MGFSVTGPEQTINGRTVKAFFTEQIIFDVQILDIADTEINNYDETGADTIIDLEAGSGDKTSLFPAGAVVWLHVESGSGYIGRGVVQSSAFGTPHAGQTTITFTEKFFIGSTSVIDIDDFLYIISQKKSRFWRIYQGNTSTAVTSELYVHPQETGLIEIDTGPVLQDYLRANSLNHFFFTIGFREAPFAGTVHGTDYLAVDGIEGYMSDFGSAAYWFVYDDQKIPEGGVTKEGTLPMSRFFSEIQNVDFWHDRGRYWKGWTTYAYYLFDEDTGVANIETNTHDHGEDFAVIRSAVATNYVTAATDPQVIELEVTRTAAGEAADDVFFVVTTFSDQQTVAIIGKKVYWEVLEPCKNPVMVKWRNSAGGFSYWLFSLNQIIEHSITSQGSFKKYSTEDLSTNNTAVATIGTPVTIQRMTLEENFLTRKQAIALKEIMSSQEIYAYLEMDGSRDIQVTAQPQSWIFETKSLREEKQPIKALTQGPSHGEYSTGTVQLIIDFPENFDFYKAKGY